jgi:hypothetical protein
MEETTSGNMKRITFEAEPGLREDLMQLASENHRSLSGEIRMALKAYVKKHGKDQGNPED